MFKLAGIGAVLLAFGWAVPSYAEPVGLVCEGPAQMHRLDNGVMSELSRGPAVINVSIDIDASMFTLGADTAVASVTASQVTVIYQRESQDLTSYWEFNRQTGEFRGAVFGRGPNRIVARLVQGQCRVAATGATIF